MRILVVGLLTLATSAAAEPVRVTCFEGTEVIKIGKVDKTFKAVVKRTIDPAAGEVRTQGWTQKDPHREKIVTYKMDVAAGTFTVDDADIGAHGTGTLVGKPWHWTSYTMKISSKGFDIAASGDFGDDAEHSHATMSKDGKQVGTVDVAGTSFDCAKLDDKRAALAK